MPKYSNSFKEPGSSAETIEITAEFAKVDDDASVEILETDEQWHDRKYSENPQPFDADLIEKIKKALSADRGPIDLKPEDYTKFSDPSIEP